MKHSLLRKRSSQEIRKLKRYSFHNFLDRREKKFFTRKIFVLFVKSYV